MNKGLILVWMQLYLNWQRKSVVGYSFDFALTVSIELVACVISCQALRIAAN